MHRIAWIVMLSAVLCACGAQADTWVVDQSGSGDFLTIQEGVTAAVSGDTVLVAPGTYGGVGNRGIDFAGKDLTVRSSGGAELTVIDCGSQDRAFHIHSGESSAATIEGFTVRNGRANEGAAVYVTSSSSCTIRNCVIEDCSTEFSSYAGGAGVYADSNAEVHLSLCTVRDNLTGAYGGGAHFRDGAQAVIEDCAFQGNYAGYNGGGVHVVADAHAHISGTVFVENSADSYGGGIYVQMASAAIEDCTFYANSAGTFAGGIGCAQADPTITRCIVSHSTTGEGIGCTVFPGPTNPQIWNCNVFGNAGGDALCGTHWNNSSVDPLYCFAAGGDLSLCADSPCVAGNNPWGVDIGGIGSGCSECGTGLPGQEASWATIKGMFR
jgi:predicted outer membrane repeat protein